MATNERATEPIGSTVGGESVEQSQSEAVPKNNDANASLSTSPLETSELGCRLGSFWDVAHSIGIQVTALTLEPVKEDNHGPVAQQNPDTVTPSTSRRLAKFGSLVWAFTESMFHAGYIVRSIDAKLYDKNARSSSKTWNMEVCFVTSNTTEPK